MEPLYFHNLLRTALYTAEYNRLSYGIMYERNRLYFERFKVVPALVPPLAEQRAIVRLIEVETATLITTIERAEREIELLREYRTTLTAAVVTGKLDVRDAAMGLPTSAEVLPSEDGPDDADEPDEADE
jgi:type I restriction enzyme S subunit